jgi:hypothetical protein
MATITEEKRPYEPQAIRPSARSIREESIPPEITPLEWGERLVLKNLVRGSTFQGFLAGAAAVMSILGLVGLVPIVMAAVAVIGIGAAFLSQGLAITARLKNLTDEAVRNRLERIEFGSGLTAEFLAGCTGILLGILSLAGVASLTLVSVAAIIYGAGLFLGSGLTARIAAWHRDDPETSDPLKHITREATRATAGVQWFVGAGAIVLGILSLVSYAPLELALVAMLGIGSVAVLSSTSICTRALSLMPRQ